MSEAAQFATCVLALMVIIGVSAWWGFYRSSGGKRKMKKDLKIKAISIDSLEVDSEVYLELEDETRVWAGGKITNVHSSEKVRDYCPWLLRRTGRQWLCKIEDDYCTHQHYASCTRHAKAMALIADPLSQELIKMAIEEPCLEHEWGEWRLVTPLVEVRACPRCLSWEQRDLSGE